MASKSEILKYILKFEKETGALKAAGLDVDELTKKTGKDQPEAAGKAESAYKKWLKESKEGLHLLRSPMELVHKTMGAISGVVALGVIAWELFRGKTEEVTKAVEESRNKHLDMLEVYRKAIDAGVKLTEVQENYRQSLHDVSQEEGAKLKESLQKTYEELTLKRDALLDTAKAQGMSTANLNQALAQEGAYDIQTQHLRQSLRDLNAALKDNAAQMEAVASGAKDPKDLSERNAREAEAKRKILEIEAQTKINHAQAMLQLEKSGAQEILQSTVASAEEKKALLEKNAADALAIRKSELDTELSIVNHQADVEHQSVELKAVNLKRVEQKYADDVLVIKTNLARAENKINEDKRKKLEAVLQAEMHAFSSAFAQRIAQTNNLGSALQAAGANVINTLAGQAATEIEIQGARAAAAAYAAGMLTGGPIGAIAAAASTMVFYTGLAALVGGVGAVAAGAIDGGGAGGGSAPGSSSSSPVYTAPADSSSAGSGGMVPAGGGGPGSGTINIALYLDREVILRLIQRASFSGELQISANAISP